MAKIAFIGLGNMGGPMAANLVKGQHQVMAFDLSATALDAAVGKGAKKVASAADAVKGAEIVVTMLPAGKHVREVYEKDVLPNVAKGTPTKNTGSAMSFSQSTPLTPCTSAMAKTTKLPVIWAEKSSETLRNVAVST